MRYWQQRAIDKTDIGQRSRTRCNIADRFYRSLRLHDAPFPDLAIIEGIFAALHLDNSSNSGLRSLDECDPVAAIRATDLPHHKVIARIHRADLDFFVRKDHDDPISDVDNYLLLGIHTPGRELFELA